MKDGEGGPRPRARSTTAISASRSTKHGRSWRRRKPRSDNLDAQIVLQQPVIDQAKARIAADRGSLSFATADADPLSATL